MTTKHTPWPGFYFPTQPKNEIFIETNKRGNDMKIRSYQAIIEWGNTGKLGRAESPRFNTIREAESWAVLFIKAIRKHGVEAEIKEITGSEVYWPEPEGVRNG